MSTEASPDTTLLAELDFEPSCDAWNVGRTVQCDQPAMWAVWLAVEPCSHATPIEVSCKQHYEYLIEMFSRGCHCKHCGARFGLDQLRSRKL